MNSIQNRNIHTGLLFSLQASRYLAGDSCLCRLDNFLNGKNRSEVHKFLGPQSTAYRMHDCIKDASTTEWRHITVAVEAYYMSAGPVSHIAAAILGQ